MENTRKRQKISGGKEPQKHDAHWEAVSRWQIEEEAAEAMVPILGRLYRRRNIIVSVFGHRINNLSAIELIKVHAEAIDSDGNPIFVTQTKPLLDALDLM